jgi:hypothetical protein
MRKHEYAQRPDIMGNASDVVFCIDNLKVYTPHPFILATKADEEKIKLDSGRLHGVTK